jgi:zona occludens toxin (predicted ATPase)
MLEGHPVVHHGARMVKLTRLPPSKHVLMLSTPLISKIKNKIRDINEFKYKFREVFKALKINVSRKLFPTTFMLVSLGLFAFIS